MLWGSSLLLTRVAIMAGESARAQCHRVGSRGSTVLQVSQGRDPGGASEMLRYVAAAVQNDRRLRAELASPHDLRSIARDELARVEAEASSQDSPACA